METPRNAPLPATPPAASPLPARILGFLLLGGTMWLAGLLALWRSLMAVLLP